MDLQTSKLELVELILKIKDKKTITKLISVLKSEDQDFWNDLSADEQDEIRMGIEQLDSGNRISLEEFIRKVS